MNSSYLILDVCSLIGVALLGYRNLSLLHPLSAYLFFHAYSFTYRAWEIYNGAPTMYSIGYSSKYEPITISEIERALLYADIALLCFATGSWFSRKRAESALLGRSLYPWKPIQLAPTLSIIYLTVITGSALFVLIRARQANFDFGALGNYAGVTTMWPMTGLIALYFIHGKFWPIALPSLLYLSVVSLQGYHRFMLVLPFISLLAVYLFHHRRRWPTFNQWALVVLMMLVFPSLKDVGRTFSDGDYKGAIRQVYDSITGKSAPLLEDKSSGFLDQFAGFLSMADQFGQLEYGRTYTGILTLPVPRAWWPEKPGLADHIVERSTQSRPYGIEGRIITYIGESYVNFGFIGVMLIPFLGSMLLCTLYERFKLLPSASLAALTYIYLYSSLIQAYRDGFNSVILFSFVYNMPLIFIWIVHAGVKARPFTLNMQRPLR